MKANNYMLFMGFFFLIYMAPMLAYVQRICNECNMYKAINKRSVAVVLFYQETKEMRKDCYSRSMLCNATAVLERLGRLAWYNDGDVIFIMANVVCQSLCEYVDRLGIMQLPSYVLYYNSVCIKDQHGRVAALHGYADRASLEDFIYMHVGGTLEDNVAQRAEEREIAREQARIMYEYYGPYMYWGYPYWGGYGFGMNIGWY